jgi:hypothetical protein
MAVTSPGGFALIALFAFFVHVSASAELWIRPGDHAPGALRWLARNRPRRPHVLRMISVPLLAFETGPHKGWRSAAVVAGAHPNTRRRDGYLRTLASTDSQANKETRYDSAANARLAKLIVERDGGTTLLRRYRSRLD